ncbi:SNF2-related protein [Bradyrhizobium ottawaense]|uniref:SNF2-related protein n=1 Tax=Bradyrhizobium ottawaense TaxID=931866 RepID=UPI0018D2B1C5|nr:SNF2-related protein [Bradyrhizobium ottawaense]
MRDIQHLLSLQNGANFSVPGAGKTTVSLALHILARKPGQHILVVGPKTAFPAWREVVEECIADDAPGDNAEKFTVLSGSSEAIQRALSSGATRFVINYDLMIQIPEIITSYLSRQPVHLLLDEAHRMKAGFRSQRGAFLLNVAPLPIRRDILTGTPMPQHPSDIQSQLDFLWPGAGLGFQIGQGLPRVRSWDNFTSGLPNKSWAFRSPIEVSSIFPWRKDRWFSTASSETRHCANSARFEPNPA